MCKSYIIVNERGEDFVDLGDSRVTCGAWVKGRSPSWGLNLEGRRRSALEAAYDVAMVIPWTPTRFQPADVLRDLDLVHLISPLPPPASMRQPHPLHQLR